MTKLTKEEQIQAIYDLKVGYTLGQADVAIMNELARIALASLEAEPVAYMTYKGYLLHAAEPKLEEYSEPMPLYAAPQLPHPAVPDEIDVNDPVLDTHRKWMAEGWNRCRSAMLHGKTDGNSPVTPDCWCRICRPVTMSDMRFVVCPECGNKRCPHANDHNNACTGSNEPGRVGGAYPAAPQQEVNK